MDLGQTATLTGGEHMHVDHGYAVTSHSAQGATADRVIVHAESSQSAALVNQRFAYVAGSRMREGLDVYTDSSQQLTSSLDRQFDKTSAVNDRAVGHSNSDHHTGRSKGGQSPEESQSVQAGPEHANSAQHEVGQGR
jgi:ATP-dependent exoDNAse (exonuclease V) alpha subunit